MQRDIALSESDLGTLSQTVATLRRRKLIHMFRYTGFQAFMFTPEPPPSAEFVEKPVSLRACCPWQIWANGKVLLADTDFGPGRRRRDKKAGEFYDLVHIESDELNVIDTEVGRDASLRISFQNGAEIKVQPAATVLPDEPYDRESKNNPVDAYYLFGPLQSCDFSFDLTNPANEGLFCFPQEFETMEHYEARMARREKFRKHCEAEQAARPAGLWRRHSKEAL